MTQKIGRWAGIIAACLVLGLVAALLHIPTGEFFAIMALITAFDVHCRVKTLESKVAELEPAVSELRHIGSRSSK